MGWPGKFSKKGSHPSKDSEETRVSAGGMPEGRGYPEVGKFKAQHAGQCGQ